MASQNTPHSAAHPLDPATASLTLVAVDGDLEEYEFIDENGYFAHVETPLISSVSTLQSWGTMVTAAQVQPLFYEIYNLTGITRQLSHQFRRNRSEIADLLVSLSEKQEENNNLKTTNAALLSIAQGRGGDTRHSPLHPDPDKFSKGDGVVLNDFITNMQLKMNMNADWWLNEQQRMGYFCSRLDGTAKDVIKHGIGKDGLMTFDGIQAILVVLKASFGDVDEGVTAQSNILLEKQGNKSLAAFLPLWQSLAARSGFEDTANIAILRAALHPSITERISFRERSLIPTNLPLYLAMVREIDSTLRQINPNYHKSKKTTPQASATPYQQPQPTNDSAGEPMDLSTANIPTPTVVWHGSQGGKIRPKDDAERAAKKLYCQQKGLCNWCESSKHRIPDCPDAPFNKDNKLKQGSKKGGNKVKFAAADVASDTESENL